MEALLNRYRNLTVLLVVILAQLLLLAYQVKTNQDVRLIRVWAVTAITPIAHVLEVVRANTIGIAENYFVLIKVRETNQRLTQENGQLKLENSFLRTELQTADRVKALSAFPAADAIADARLAHHRQRHRSKLQGRLRRPRLHRRRHEGHGGGHAGRHCR